MYFFLVLLFHSFLIHLFSCTGCMESSRRMVMSVKVGRMLPFLLSTFTTFSLWARNAWV
jgi:hypothetical protein